MTSFLPHVILTFAGLKAKISGLEQSEVACCSLESAGFLVVHKCYLHTIEQSVWWWGRGAGS